MQRFLSSLANIGLIALIVVVLMLGVSWQGGRGAASSSTPNTATVGKETARLAPTATPIPGDNAPRVPIVANTNVTASQRVTGNVAASQPPVGAPITNVAPVSVVAPPNEFNRDVTTEVGDAPLLVQAPGTINFLLLGSDAAGDERYARTDTVMIASVNPDVPSVSLLSFPRDMQVKIPGRGEDRINTVMEYGFVDKYPGGGVSFLAAVLRKNFGVKIDHFVRIDFAGFVKAVDTLGGVDVLVECELHDTFPDKASPNGRTDLDLYPGKVSLSGKQALWYSRSRWSTSDFDRARRQQKVLRAAMSKARRTNLLQNALPLFATFRSNIQTDLGVSDIAGFVEIARRMDDLAVKSRVLSFPAVKPFTRRDGAMVLQPQAEVRDYIAEALSPPPTNRAQNLPKVEVVNATSKPDMEAVAAERLAWEGFQVVALIREPRRATTQLVDYAVTPKGSPIARLQSIFNVARRDIVTEADPSSAAAARVVLGDNYNSCPNTYQQSRDVTLSTEPKQLIPTSTPAP